jgi:ribonuclease R
MHEVAEHLSATERNSADAERDSKDVKLFAYLRAQLESGKPVPYRALVTEVRNFGFFVDVQELALSGMVHLSSVTDDFYQFDPELSRLVGRRSQRVIRLGDEVTVQVLKVDGFKKQVDFRFAGPLEPGKPRQAVAGARSASREGPRSESGGRNRRGGRGGGHARRSARGGGAPSSRGQVRPDPSGAGSGTGPTGERAGSRPGRARQGRSARGASRRR